MSSFGETVDTTDAGRSVEEIVTVATAWVVVCVVLTGGSTGIAVVSAAAVGVGVVTSS